MSYLDREAWVARSFVALTHTLVQGHDTIDLLDQLVACCVELLTADAAGILLGDAGDRLRVMAASSDDAALLELLGLDTRDSPWEECLDSADRVRVPDVEQVRSRWPEFAVAVNRAGAFRSVHALPLRLRGKAIGVLCLLHNRTGFLLDDDLALGQALADVAAIGTMSEVLEASEGAVGRDEVIERLRTALADRVVVNQATGVIAQQVGLNAGEAYALLRDYSRGHHQRLRELARQIVARELDPLVLRTPTG